MKPFRKANPGRGLKYWRASKPMTARSPWSGRAMSLRRGDSAAVLVCCDCGLVHDFRWRIERGYVLMTGWRDQPTTLRVRKRDRITVHKRGKAV